MTTTGTEHPAQPGAGATTPPSADALTRKQLRGSSLLLVGKAMAMAVTFGLQILIIHATSKADYGAFQYALTFVVLGQTLTTFGLDRAVTRFLPIYHEREDYGRLFGTLLLVLGTVTSLGVLVVVTVYAFSGQIESGLLGDGQSADRTLAVQLLLVLVLMAPIEALDDLIEGITAVFASPRTIFFRKYVLAPGLRLSVVLTLVLMDGDVHWLAAGWVGASALGFLVYVTVLVRVLRRSGLTSHFSRRGLVNPWRELFGFTVPLLTSDLVFVVMTTTDTILLGKFGSLEDVATYKSVLPLAILNQFVLQSFTLLFTPSAARLFARGDHEGINALYWRTALWVAVLSFPIFAVTFSLAQPATELLYGNRYEGAWPILAIMSFGYFFNAALGFNGLTLKVYGRLRYIVGINVVVALANIGFNLVLIPRYGPVGAAVGTCMALVLHNILKQGGLLLGTGISLFDRRYSPSYLVLALGAAGLFVLAWLLPDDYSLTTPTIYVTLLGATAVYVVLLRVSRHRLDAATTFPAVLKVPVLRRLLSS